MADWINGAYLVSGLGLGWLAGFAARRLKQQSVPTVLPEPVERSQAALLKLQQTELAYQMARQMSQFKAGFLARTSHELRSPLNGLIGIHQLILADLCESPEEEREFIAQAHESALKLVQLLDEIINVAKVEHGTRRLELQPVQLSDLLQDVQDLTYLQIQNRNLRLRLTLPDPSIYVLADPRWLRQVLVSLVDGAIDQMQEGTIALTVDCPASATHAHIVIDDERPAASWSEPQELLQSALRFDLLSAQEAAQQVKHVDLSQKPPAGFTLLLNQTLMEVMQGRLDLVEVSTEAGTRTCLQCSIPIVQEDA